MTRRSLYLGRKRREAGEIVDVIGTISGEGVLDTVGVVVVGCVNLDFASGDNVNLSLRGHWGERGVSLRGIKGHLEFVFGHEILDPANGEIPGLEREVVGSAVLRDVVFRGHDTVANHEADGTVDVDMVDAVFFVGQHPEAFHEFLFVHANVEAGEDVLAHRVGLETVTREQMAESVSLRSSGFFAEGIVVIIQNGGPEVEELLGALEPASVDWAGGIDKACNQVSLFGDSLGKARGASEVDNVVFNLRLGFSVQGGPGILGILGSVADWISGLDGEIAKRDHMLLLPILGKSQEFSTGDFLAGDDAVLVYRVEKVAGGTVKDDLGDASQNKSLKSSDIVLAKRLEGVGSDVGGRNVRLTRIHDA